MERERFTRSGVPLKRIYTQADLNDFDSAKFLGDAGEYPFTRGIYKEMYREIPWVIQVGAGFDMPEDTRKRVEYLQKIGIRHYKVPNFGVYLDLVTQLGLDSDNEDVSYEVGKEGVHINSINDMSELLSAVDLENVHFACTSFGSAPMIFSLFIAVAEERGTTLNNLFGSLNNCPLSGPCGENLLFLKPRAHLRLMLDLMEFCIQNVPKFQPVTISTYDIRENGATAVQEVALGLAIATEILREAKKRNLNLDEVASRMHFHVQAGDYLFEEVAKLRAMRRMWASLTRERFAIKDPKACRVKFQSNTQGSSLQVQEPLNNIVRTTLHTLAAVLSGVQTIHTCSYDEAYAVPAASAAKLAVRTQQVILEESGVADVVDPLGGSYYVECLTNEMEKRVWVFLDEIEKRGGYIKCLESGFLLREITTSALKIQVEISEGRKAIVGVNKYVDEESPTEVGAFRHNEEAPRVARERIIELRRTRDNNRVKQTLEGLRQALDKGENTIRPMVEAFKAKATMGEVCGVNRDALGEYVPKG